MSFSAVIFCDSALAASRLAGLQIVDRLVISAHRAGAAEITIVAEKLFPTLERAPALGIQVKHATALPVTVGPVLLLSNRLLVQTSDLKHLVKRKARLISAEGTLFPAGLVENTRTGQTIEEALARSPGVVAQGVAAWVTNETTRAAAARALWASLASSEDGLVDKHFNRPVGRWLSKILVYTPVSPNQVSVAATLLGLVSAWLFAQGGYRSALWGAVLLQVSAIIDCVDGELARVMFKESGLGKWLDIVGDQLVHMGVFAGIGLGLYRAASDGPVLLLATSAVVGVILSFAVVLHGRTQPEGRQNARLQKLIDTTTNRDFSVLLLVLATAGKLPWFLWLTAIGVHLFWLSALGVQLWPAAEPTHDSGT